MKNNRSLSTDWSRGSVWDFMNQVERVFDDLWTTPSPASPTAMMPSFRPPADLQENENFFLITLDLPGMSEKQIHVDVHQGRVTISGERAREHKDESKNFSRFERSVGRFERSFQLPSQIDESKIQASFENGVLEVLIPKTETAKPRSVQIESGKGGLLSRLMGKKEDVAEKH